MTFRLRLIAGCVVLCLWMGSIPSVFSSGIPTVDVVSISQQLTSYVTQLGEFQQLILSVGLEESQLAQMLLDYEQKLREYRSYLNQLRSVQNFISDPDWARLVKIVVKTPYGQGIIGKIPFLKPDDPDYKEQVRERFQEYGFYPEATEEVLNDLHDVGISGDDAKPFEAYNDELEQNLARYEEQLNMASVNQRDIEERTELINEYGDKIRNLGDESDLATMQMGLTQDNFASHQREALIRAMTQNGLNYESPTNVQMQRKAKMIREEVERLKRVRGRGGAKMSGITSFAGPGF